MNNENVDNFSPFRRYQRKFPENTHQLAYYTEVLENI